ncbi:MAG: hypothetical protein WKF71_13030 [Pyrinomonadaceae bacterium]
MSEDFTIEIDFGDVKVGNVLVTTLGENLYRLEQSPLDERAFYKDIIQAKKQEDGSLLFEKVVELSGRNNYCYLLSKKFYETSEFEELLKKIEKSDGYWEQVFGGILVVSLPPDSQTNLPKEIAKLKKLLNIE